VDSFPLTKFEGGLTILPTIIIGALRHTACLQCFDAVGLAAGRASGL